MGDHIADTTLMLDIGDHPFIEKKSVVLFAKAEKLNVRKIQEVLDKPFATVNWKRFSPCTPELLLRVQQGLVLSKHTKRSIKDHCRQIWKL